MKKIFLIFICPFLLSSCVYDAFDDLVQSSKADEVEKSLNYGLYKEFVNVKAGGSEEGNGILSAKYKAIWSGRTFALSPVETQNPGLSQFWLEKYGLLTNDLRIQNGTIHVESSSEFTVRDSEFCVYPLAQLLLGTFPL